MALLLWDVGADLKFKARDANISKAGDSNISKARDANISKAQDANISNQRVNVTAAMALSCIYLLGHIVALLTRNLWTERMS